mmetsp:Transcript_38155/g.120154  ORF Transcript_38155/g.120154 Transcript_38155/m.120154 type:complete len:315 (+) Transcript_38155:271-1215(+)
MSTAACESMNSHTPSDAITSSCGPSAAMLAAGSMSTSFTSGLAMTPLPPTRWSPMERAMARPGSVMFASSHTRAGPPHSSSGGETKPPAFSIRFCSAGVSGFWSSDSATAFSLPAFWTAITCSHSRCREETPSSATRRPRGGGRCCRARVANVRDPDLPPPALRPARERDHRSRARQLRVDGGVRLQLGVDGDKDLLEGGLWVGSEEGVLLELGLHAVHRIVRHLVAAHAVPVEHTEECRRLLPLDTEWVADAAAVLVDLCHHLAGGAAGLDAVARVGANHLGRKGGRHRLCAHLGTHREAPLPPRRRVRGAAD